MTPEIRTPLLTVALAIALAACRDAPPASIVDVHVPVPGDPAIYAPDGWPLRIGDRVTDEDRDRLRKEFLSPTEDLRLHTEPTPRIGSQHAATGQSVNST